MAYTTPTTRTTGELITAAIWNQDLVDNISFLANPPACTVYNNANISVATATPTAVTFNSERFDTDAMHSTSSNTSRITMTTAGVYVVTASILIASNATGRRVVDLRLNGTTGLAQVNQNTNTADDWGCTITRVYKFAANDYVEVVVTQNSGGNLNIRGVGNTSPEFSAAWVGRG